MIKFSLTLNKVISFITFPHPIFKTQNRNLVNVKLKWVNDHMLDSVVSQNLNLKPTCTLVSLIGSHSLPIYRLSRYRGRLGLPNDLKIKTYIRRYPNIFQEFYVPDSSGTPVPWYKLTDEALQLYDHEKSLIYEQCCVDIVNRLQKLLMLSKGKVLPLQTVDQLSWDLGLPYDYENEFVCNWPELFSFVKMSDERVGLKLIGWDDCLGVSHLESRNLNRCVEKDGELEFPIRFTRGFGLKRKCMEWLNEWQKLPYTCPYVDASHLDPRTDVSEKRVVGVFHELLHLTILKKIERANVSNMRGPLSMPQKFTKVFERHPGIFYISKKGDRQTVVLREAYDRRELVEKHPLADVREKYASMMKKGFLDRSRGLYKKEACVDDRAKISFRPGYRFESETETDCDFLSEYESD